MIADRLSAINSRIQAAAHACARNPHDIRLVTVSKTQPTERVQAAIAAGAAILGENYIQEAREKFNALSAHDASWHFIGHLQTNKAKYAVRIFDLIHTVDSLKLARELNKQAAKNNKTQQVLLQVNISGEETKSGGDPREIIDLAKDISVLAQIEIRGLMTMPPFFDDPQKARPYFRALREMRDQIRRESIPGVSMSELSMGMTGDFEVAIQEGATLIRVGTAIFGERK